MVCLPFSPGDVANLSSWFQGAFNFFVYTRVKANRWRKAEPQASPIWIYKQIVMGTPVPMGSRSARSTKTPRASGSLGSSRINRSGISHADTKVDPTGAHTATSTAEDDVFAEG